MVKSKKNEATIKIFEDGEWKEYKRDFAKTPLTIEDWFNANKLDIAMHNYQNSIDSDSEVDVSVVKPYVEGTLKFIVAFFRDQFNFEQAKGIAPEVMQKKMNDWYAMSSGVMGTLDNDSKK